MGEDGTGDMRRVGAGREPGRGAGRAAGEEAGRFHRSCLLDHGGTQGASPFRLHILSPATVKGSNGCENAPSQIITAESRIVEYNES